MKTVLSALLLVGLVALALCEVPPPYPPRGFKPSPAFNLPVRQPQATYGVPNALPSKFSQSSPQTQYGIPNQPTLNLTPNFSSKQSIPSTSYGVAVTATPYRTIISESQRASCVSTQQGGRQTPSLIPNFNSKQTIPNNSYGAPVTSSPYRTIVNEPQVIYGAPLGQIRPTGQYDVPDVKNIETLEQIRQLNSLIQLTQSSNSNQQKQINANLLQSQNSNANIGIPSQQYLPVKEAGNFRGDLQLQNSQFNPQRPALEYLPVKEPTNFRNDFDLSQSNSQQPFNSQVNPNLQQPSQQYLPVREPLNFKKIVTQTTLLDTPNSDLTGQNIQQSVNYQQPTSNPQIFNGAGNVQNKLGNFNQQQGNVPQFPQNRNPNLNSYNPPQQNSFQIDRLNVRPLQNPDKVQISIPQNIPRPIQNVQQNREFGGSNIQGQVDERYLPPSTVRPPQQNSVQIERLNVRPLQNPDKVQISIPQNVPRPIQNIQQNRQFGGSNIQGQVGERYLPPSTVRPIQRPTSTLAPLPKDSSGEDELTESREEVGGPNIAVATAVSGVPDGQSFYLLQPDGRLQRVVYQKTRAEGDRENEYTANYLFQNIQAEPGLAYNPLITLGKR